MMRCFHGSVRRTVSACSTTCIGSRVLQTISHREEQVESVRRCGGHLSVSSKHRGQFRDPHDSLDSPRVEIAGVELGG